MNKKFFILIITGAVIIFLGAWFYNFYKNYNNKQILLETKKTTHSFVSGEQAILKVGEDRLTVDVMTSLKDQVKGLAGRDNLSDNYGMLFFYDELDNRSFWMKGMLVDIDIIWLKTNPDTGIITIVGYEDNVPAELGVSLNNLKIYRSTEPVDIVLEVRSGLRAANNWDVGTVLQFE